MVVKKTNWQQRLIDASKRKRFLASDLADADNWMKCAVGEWQGAFQADPEGCPKGGILYDLGHSFRNAVEDNDVNAAASNYKKIQTYIKGNINRRKNALTKAMSMRTGMKVAR